MLDSFRLQAVAEAQAALEGDARNRLREAVVAARLDGHSWADIGRALGVSRQAASQRFECDEQVAKAWHHVDMLLRVAATRRGWHGLDMDTVLARLSEEGALRPVDIRYLEELGNARRRTVHDRELSLEEAERVTDQAIPLAARLSMVAEEPPPRPLRRRYLAFAGVGASSSGRGAAEADELLDKGFGRD